MKMRVLFPVLAVLLLVVCMPLHAQGGCVDSPENPPAILALAGGLGAGCAALRQRLRSASRKGKQPNGSVRNQSCREFHTDPTGQ